MLPAKKILTKAALNHFLASSTCDEIVQFVLQTSESVKGKPNSFSCSISPIVQRIINTLKTMNSWVDEIPPLPNKTRFGNKAFVTFEERVEERLESLMKDILPESHHAHIPAIQLYFLNSFGDKQRIDYGSGHELNFAMWIFCLQKIRLIEPPDYTALVLVAFREYLTLMRRLQVTYWLEPAGSHGVWGLDDYHFLPFLWGSSQLIGHKYIKPKSICNQDVLDGFGKEYMYLECVRFINQVKVGSFFEHSPLLFDISGVRNWEKVNEGMVKMFKAEVLGKLPIMKHFFFGELIAYEPPQDLNVPSETHAHHENCKDDHSTEETGSKEKYRVKSCCVQRIPSPFAAKNAEASEKL